MDVNLDPKLQPEKRGKTYESDDWFISGLPDGVLIVILSFLPLREVVRTSVLSSRWTNLWRYSMRLNFHDDVALRKIAQHYRKSRNKERRKYIDWVNLVLQSNRAPTLEEFRICFDLDNLSRREITTWLKFASARRVQRLELSLLGYGDCDLADYEPYNFPATFIGRSTSKRPSLGTHFKSLKSLCLRCVNVSGKDIEFFLWNYPFLEELIVQGSDKLSKIKVCGPSLVLKRLEIFDCYPCGSPIWISAPNLTSLKIETLSGLLLENVPKLVEFNLINGYRDLYRGKLVHVLHCCISQLQILTLNLTCFEELKFCALPQMPKLKKLKIEYLTRGDESLMVLTSFIGASPHLQEFEVKVRGCTLSRTNKQVQNGVTHSPHQHLKVFKFSGYYGRSSDVELVRYIWVNCVALQKIIIDPRYQPIGPPKLLASEDIEWERTARDYAKHQLETNAPLHIQLLIL